MTHAGADFMVQPFALTCKGFFHHAGGLNLFVVLATGVRDGYALVLGIDHGRLIEELARQSNLHVIAVDDDPGKVAAVRNRLDGMGLYGTRVSVLAGDPVTYPFPPYVASLVVSETPDDLEQAGEQALALAVFHTLRPYGGVACAWGSLADRRRTEQIAQNVDVLAFVFDRFEMTYSVN